MTHQTLIPKPHLATSNLLGLTSFQDPDDSFKDLDPSVSVGGSCGVTGVIFSGDVGFSSADGGTVSGSLGIGPAKREVSYSKDDGLDFTASLCHSVTSTVVAGASGEVCTNLAGETSASAAATYGAGAELYGIGIEGHCSAGVSGSINSVNLITNVGKGISYTVKAGVDATKEAASHVGKGISNVGKGISHTAKAGINAAKEAASHTVEATGKKAVGVLAGLEAAIEHIYTNGLPYSPCFAAGTEVTTPFGTVPIENIKVGDKVMAFDPLADEGRGRLVAKEVTQIFRNTTTEWLKLTWLDKGTAKEVITTPGHHFLREDGHFGPVSEMVENGQVRVILKSGEVATCQVESIVYSEETAALFNRATSFAVAGSGALALDFIDAWETYNFEVADLHTYVACDIRVHNDCTNTNPGNSTGTTGGSFFGNLFGGGSSGAQDTSNDGNEGNEGNEGDEGNEGNEGNEGDEGNEGNEGNKGSGLCLRGGTGPQCFLRP